MPKVWCLGGDAIFTKKFYLDRPFEFFFKIFKKLYLGLSFQGKNPKIDGWGLHLKGGTKVKLQTSGRG